MSDQKQYFPDGHYVEWTDLNKDERSRLRPIVGAVIAAILIFGSLIYAVRAWAEGASPSTVLVAEVGENRLSIFQDTCALGGWFATWKKALWFYRGRNVDACWTIRRSADDGQYYADTVDADGDTGSIPMAMFRKAKGA